ncbi:MAG: hypothetical protein QY332_08250 [Anaerolineales bacterium]|nr:MAG: hypothetical protein QY332_08250 [Anaerolineales bacterium]
MPKITQAQPDNPVRAGDSVRDAASPSILFPQLIQNFAPAKFAVPQFGQNNAVDAPQYPQTFAVSGTCFPQFLHCMVFSP